MINGIQTILPRIRCVMVKAGTSSTSSMSGMRRGTCRHLHHGQVRRRWPHGIVAAGTCAAFHRGLGICPGLVDIISVNTETYLRPAAFSDTATIKPLPSALPSCARKYSRMACRRSRSASGCYGNPPQRLVDTHSLGVSRGAQAALRRHLAHFPHRCGASRTHNGRSHGGAQSAVRCRTRRRLAAGRQEKSIIDCNSSW